MELTPLQIDEARTRTAIALSVHQSFGSLDFDALEKQAFKQHPPVFRTTEPVSEALRNLPVKLAKMKRQPKIKKHVLP